MSRPMVETIPAIQKINFYDELKVECKNINPDLSTEEKFDKVCEVFETLCNKYFTKT